MRILYFITALFPFLVSAQVGVNTDTPSATLDVVGDVLIDGHLFLENPGANDELETSSLLIMMPDGTFKKYDIDASKYGALNYSQVKFSGTAKEGLLEFDTLIDIDEYVITVQGFYFLDPDGRWVDTNVLLKSTLDPNTVEGFQMYAYRNPSTNTWFIRAFVNNSDFQGQAPTGPYTYSDTTIDIYVNFVAYRNRFITKPRTTVTTIDMNGSETGIAPLPVGF